jgi:hypothetical protein
MFGARVRALGSAVIVNYEARTTGYDAAFQLVPLASPIADQYGDSLIVIQQTRHPFTRWVPIVRGEMYAFRRQASGEWVSARQ